MSDIGKILLIRKSFPVTQDRIYLNTGAVGPLSNVTLEVLNQANVFDYEMGRASQDAWDLKYQSKDTLRDGFAALVHSTPAEIALTNHTTNGMNIVVHGLNWQAGDEVITTNLEHPGGLIPLYVLQQRYGVIVKVLEISPQDRAEAIVARFEAAITPRTRLLSYSHIAWNLGLALPLAEIVALGHQYGIMSLVDGAQSTGAIPLDLPASQVDFYAMPGQKWLCGPEGVGALYIRSNRIAQIAQTFAGYASLDDAQYDWAGSFTAAPGAQRYELATVYVPGIKAMIANLNWLSKSVGWDWIHARIVDLARTLRQQLVELPGVTLLTPHEASSGLTSFTVADHDPEEVATALFESGIVVRTIKYPACIRVSTGFYNTEDEIEQLIDGLRRILS